MEYFYAHNPFLTLRKLNSLQIQLKAELNLNDWIERRFCSASTLIVLLRTAVERRPVGGQDLRLAIVNAACYIGACICRGRLPVLPIISPKIPFQLDWPIYFSPRPNRFFLFSPQLATASTVPGSHHFMQQQKLGISFTRRDGRTNGPAVVDLHRAPGDDKLLFCSS